jgi:signal transduction histidine kinase
VIRHAQATRTFVTLQFDAEAVILTISDDGCGFKPPETPAEFAPSGHFGLLGLHERAELIGAHLDIRSVLRHGTQMTVTLPTSTA